jgi:hypothetical protein
MNEENQIDQTQATENPNQEQPQPRVTSISLGRVYNLGNYENLRFDVSVQIPEGQSAAETMVMLLGILQKLRPIKQSYEVEHAMEMLNTPETELTDNQKDDLAAYRALVSAHNKRLQERKEAIRKLDHLGGSATKKDAKESWEEIDDYDND